MEKKTIKILLVEDNPSDALILRENLEHDPLSVFELTNTETLAGALTLLQQEHIDIVLLDLGLPDSYGLETFTSLYRAASTLPIIILSGQADETLALEAVHAGAQDYLVKGLAGWGIAARSIRYAIERQHNQAALRESEVLLRQVLESIPDSTFALDRDYRFLIGNQRHQQELVTSGGHPFEMGEQMLSSDYPAEVLEFWRTAYDRALAGASFSVEGSWVDLNGQSHVHENRFSPLRNTTGAIIGALVIAHDITERKQAEEKLRESEQRYTLLFQKSATPVILLKLPEAVIVDVNESAKRLTGFSREEMRGKTSAELGLISQTQRTEMLTQFDKERTLAEKEMRLVTKAGEERIIIINTNPLEIDGQPFALTSIRDVTDRKQAETALAASEQRLTSMIEHAMDAIVAADANMNVVLYNAAAEKMFGVPAAKALGQSLSLFIPEQFHSSHQKYMMELTLDRMQSIPANKVFAVSGKRANGEVFPAESSISYFERDGEKLYMAIVRDITERVKSEEALRQSEQRFAAIFESTPLPTGIARLRDGVFTDINPAFTKFLGYSREETLGRTSRELNLWWQNADRQRIVDELQSGKHVEGFKTTMRYKYGQKREVIASAVILEINNEPSLLIQIADISELENAQAATRESEEKYRLLVEELEKRVQERTAELQDLYDNAPTGYHSLDIEGKVLMVNQTELDWLGYVREEVLGHQFTEFIAEESQAGFAENLPLLLQKGEINNIEYQMQRKDGSNFAVLGGAVVIKDEHGNFLATRSTVMNNTERKKAENALRESRENLQYFFDTASDLIQSMDEHGNYLYVNSAWCKTLGYTAEEARALNMLDVVDPSYQVHCEQILRLLATDPSSHQLEALFRAKDGQLIIVEGSVSSRKDKYGHIATNGIFRNVTERKKAEEALRESYDQLSIANNALQKALRVKDEFLANMSHELRTPLNGILGMAEILLSGQRGLLNERQHTYVNTIDTSGRHLLNLINDILDLSKIEADKLQLQIETVSVMNVCQASLIFIKEIALKKGVAVGFVNDVTTTTLQADERRLKQMLVNLLSNAIKFTPSGGKVNLEVRLNREKGTIELSVSDTGIGITAEDQQRLFTSFTQVDNSVTRNHEGTGLGLALVKHLAELHGGSVSLESELGKGSRFTISLPWQESVLVPITPAKTETATDESQSLGDRKNKATILLAEDNPTNVMAVADYLDAKGFSLVIAKDGLEALEKAAQRVPDLILMDIQMPKLGGLEATRRLRADPQFATIPIIALTAQAMTGDRERCLEAGATDYLSKPVRLADLKEMIEKLLELKS